MEYKMEELIPVTAVLAEKYTSKESSSVTYETARMLLEAVVYCIEEPGLPGSFVPAKRKRPEAPEAYARGYKRVLDKVYSAKEIYDRLTEAFEDYGCGNYRDTIIKGMPRFFLYYDVRFQPHDHILTLDYPTVNHYGNLCGIDLIYEYLCDIETESRLLSCFETAAVKELLGRTEERFGIRYMENLCALVLLNAIGCVIAERPLQSLTLADNEIEKIRRYFQEDDLQTVGQKTGAYIRIITEAAGCGEIQDYFQVLRREYALRIFNGVEHRSLGGVFM